MNDRSDVIVLSVESPRFLPGWRSELRGRELLPRDEHEARVLVLEDAARPSRSRSAGTFEFGFGRERWASGFSELPIVAAQIPMLSSGLVRGKPVALPTDLVCGRLDLKPEGAEVVIWSRPPGAAAPELLGRQSLPELCVVLARFCAGITALMAALRPVYPSPAAITMAEAGYSSAALLLHDFLAVNA